MLDKSLSGKQGSIEVNFNKSDRQSNINAFIQTYLQESTCQVNDKSYDNWTHRRTYIRTYPNYRKAFKKSDWNMTEYKFPPPSFYFNLFKDYGGECNLMESALFTTCSTTDCQSHCSPLLCRYRATNPFPEAFIFNSEKFIKIYRLS